VPAIVGRQHDGYVRCAGSGNVVHGRAVSARPAGFQSEVRFEGINRVRPGADKIGQ